MFAFIFSAEFITAAIVFSALGAFVGVQLGGRSKSANRIVDSVRAKYEREAAELRERIRELQAGAK